jgi:hypothetical protein
MHRAITFALPLAIGLGLTAESAVAPSRSDDMDDFKPLFSGKNLESWEASKPEL